LDGDRFTAALKDPLILHEPRYRFLSGKTLLKVGRDEEDEEDKKDGNSWRIKCRMRTPDC
jgi:hypothetical protein